MTEFKPNETMLQNYIQNKLSPQDTEQLELWLVDHPEVMQDLELDMMFSQSKEAFKQAEQPKQTQSFSIWDYFTSKKLIPINVLAYGLALFFVFSTFLNNNTNNNFSAATFIELEKQRGAEPDVIQVQAKNNKSLVLRMFPDSMTESYSLILQSQSSNEKIEFNDLIADDFGAITVTVNNLLIDKWEVLLIGGTGNKEQLYIINLM